jgi:hypothetical protein
MFQQEFSWQVVFLVFLHAYLGDADVFAFLALTQPLSHDGDQDKGGEVD